MQKKYFSVSGCARHDIHRLRVLDDVPEKVWVECCVSQHAVCRCLPPMGNPRHRILPLALRVQDQGGWGDRSKALPQGSHLSQPG